MVANVPTLTPAPGSLTTPSSIGVERPSASGSSRLSALSTASILTRSRSTTGIFIILLLVVLYYGRALFIPVSIAILGSFLLAPLVRGLSKLHVPRALSALAILLLISGGLGTGVYALAGPAASWMKRLPEGIDQAKGKLHTVFGHVASVNAAAEQVAHLTGDDNNRLSVRVAQPSTVSSSVLSVTGELLAGLVITVITLFFLLASGSAILDRAARLIPALHREHDSSDLIAGYSGGQDTVMVLRESERLVCLYLTTTVCINALLGAVLSVGFWWAGLPNPLLWGVFAGLINFLPYIGPLIGIPIVALASVMSFDSLSPAIVPPMIYAGCAFLEGNLLTPAIVGKRLAMSPIAVFLWMAFWGWMWGAAGALIAVPMLVMVRAFCSRLVQLQPIAALIEP